MNERIQEIYKNCLTKVYEEDSYNGIPNFIGYDLDAEKFAELIIKECAQLARDTDLEDVEGGDSQVLRAAKQQILKHFGVA